MSEEKPAPIRSSGSTVSMSRRRILPDRQVPGNDRTRDDDPPRRAPAVEEVSPLRPGELIAPNLEQAIVPLASTPLAPPALESSSARAAVAQRPEADADAVAVVRTLTQYADALTRMDVSGAAQAWPSVDHRALSDAFKTLDKNGLVLNACAIEAGAGDTVVATCRASVEYVPKVGSRVPRLTSQQWRFTMRKVGDEWKIQTATVSEER